MRGGDLQVRGTDLSSAQRQVSEVGLSQSVSAALRFPSFYRIVQQAFDLCDPVFNRSTRDFPVRNDERLRERLPVEAVDALNLVAIQLQGIPADEFLQQGLEHRRDILVHHAAVHLQRFAVAEQRRQHVGGTRTQFLDQRLFVPQHQMHLIAALGQRCRDAVDAILSHEPFKSMKERFNFVAVMPPSEESGVSIPHKGEWKSTVLGSNYDTFYSDRYLTTLHLKQLHDVLAAVPYEHIVILANTENYGGGGIYNSYLMSAAHNEKTRPVVVHEFGHSFAGLADEYYYDDQYETQYPADTEPWEPNLTTLVDFDRKWKDMLPRGTKIPTKPSKKNLYTEVGVYEGGGYQSKGVYRPAQECRMKINEAPVFCPVCERAIRRVINYYTSGK